MPWAIQWVSDAGGWRMLMLDITNDNPAEVNRIERECSYTEVSEAWVNSRRKVYGVGYETKNK